MDTNKTLKIQRTILPDANQRAYHSHIKLVHSVISAECGMPESHENGILEAVLEIPGIEAAMLKPYTVYVAKSPSWDWDKVEPELVKLLGCLNFDSGIAVAQIDGAADPSETEETQKSE